MSRKSSSRSVDMDDFSIITMSKEYRKYEPIMQSAYDMAYELAEVLPKLQKNAAKELQDAQAKLEALEHMIEKCMSHGDPKNKVFGKDLSVKRATMFRGVMKDIPVVGFPFTRYIDMDIPVASFIHDLKKSAVEAVKKAESNVKQIDTLLKTCNTRKLEDLAMDHQFEIYHAQIKKTGRV